jgi:CheY-like chemotaxis protein
VRAREPPPRPKVLAVEDSPSARRLFQAVLLHLGYALQELRLASSASEALQLYTQWHPDIVFLDIELNGARLGPTPTGAPPPPDGSADLDGDTLGLQLLERNPRLPLVVVTAYDPDHPRVRSIVDRGAAAVITKPVRAAHVKEILDRFSSGSLLTGRPGRPNSGGRGRPADISNP